MASMPTISGTENEAGYESDVVLFKGRKHLLASRQAIRILKGAILGQAFGNMIKSGRGDDIILFRGRGNTRHFKFMDLPGEIRNIIYRAISPVSYVESLINIRAYHKHPLASTNGQIEVEFLPIWHTKCNFMVEIKSIPGFDFDGIYQWMARFNITTTEHMSSLCVRLDLRQQYARNYLCPFWSEVACFLFAEEEADGTERDVIEVDFGERFFIHKTSRFHQDLITYVTYNLDNKNSFDIATFVDLMKFIWFWVHQLEEDKPERPIIVCPAFDCRQSEFWRVQKYVFHAGIPTEF